MHAQRLSLFIPFYKVSGYMLACSSKTKQDLELQFSAYLGQYVRHLHIKYQIWWRLMKVKYCFDLREWYQCMPRDCPFCLDFTKFWGTCSLVVPKLSKIWSCNFLHIWANMSGTCISNMVEIDEG